MRQLVPIASWDFCVTANKHMPSEHIVRIYIDCLLHVTMEDQEITTTSLRLCPLALNDAAVRYTMRAYESVYKWLSDSPIHFSNSPILNTLTACLTAPSQILSQMDISYRSYHWITAILSRPTNLAFAVIALDSAFSETGTL